MYINTVISEKKNLIVKYWLLLITFLVGLIIIVGGLTRLTDSGLSITRWDLISGILPPLSLNDWEQSFNLYKEIPEFKLLNSSMSLEEFKVIYLWEYSHRLLGRIIGVFYFFPLVYFTFKKKINRKLLILLYLIFLLILLQGIIGWYMVQSGLTDRTDVSHYRLSLHLTLAFIIFIFLLWSFIKYNSDKNSYKNKNLPYYLPIFFLLLLVIQISLGAFVSGLDAGQVYQTWPFMNDHYFPDDSKLGDLFKLSVFDTPSLVQFIHRNIAYLISLVFLSIMFLIFKDNNFIYLRKITIIILFFLILQILLGVFTVLSGAQIILASMHQICSIFLIITSVILVFKNSKIN